MMYGTGGYSSDQSIVRSPKYASVSFWFSVCLVYRCSRGGSEFVFEVLVVFEVDNWCGNGRNICGWWWVVTSPQEDHFQTVSRRSFGKSISKGRGSARSIPTKLPSTLRQGSPATIDIASSVHRRIYHKDSRKSSKAPCKSNIKAMHSSQYD